MTPAENPNAMDKNFLFVRVVKKAIKLPIPVARPANSVKPNANNFLSFIIYPPNYNKYVINM